MYLSAIGFGVILTGILIAVDYSNFDYDATFALIFSGGVLTVVFWVYKLYVFACCNIDVDVVAIIVRLLHNALS